MINLKNFTHYTLLAAMPSLLAYPQNNLSRAPFQMMNYGYQQKTEEWIRPTTYDEIIQMLEDLESDELERKYSPMQLCRVNEYLAFLAKEGVLPNEIEEKAALEEDIYDLMYGEDSGFQLTHYLENSSEYKIIPAIFNTHSGYNIIQCGKISKAWKKTKKFAKEHKKALIITAAVVAAAAAVAVTVIVISSASAASAVTAMAGAAGAAASGSGSSNSKSKGNSSPIPNDTPIFQSAMEERISAFKENIARENFFGSSSSNHQNLPLEETGRVIGSLFAHDSFNHFNYQISNNSQFSQEMQSIALQHNFSFPPEASSNPVNFGHNEIDRRFSSNCGPMFSDPTQEVNFNALSYQMRGEAAHSYGYHNQAINDFSKAIEMNPTDPMLYLQRSTSYFDAGQYDRSLEDFHNYATQVERVPQKMEFSITEFSIGFAKGLPQGICQSGKQNFLFVADCITHPIHTAKQIYEACSTLAKYVHTKEWETIGQALSPELHKLVTEWDVLPSKIRGELAGTSFGKLGTDIMTPGIVAKIASKGVKGAKELTSVCKNLKTAEKTLILESVAQLENGGKIRELMQAKFISRAEELGFPSKEVAQLEKIGTMESEIGSIAKNISNNTSQNIVFTEHALRRAVERGVPREAIFDAIESPLKVNPVKFDSMGRASQRFIGKKAEVVLNPETQEIVSVNPISTKKAEKLINELSNVSSN